MPSSSDHRSRAQRFGLMIVGSAMAVGGALTVQYNDERSASTSGGELTSLVTGFVAPLAIGLPHLLISSGIVLLFCGLARARR
ncbi:hypothetical protein [Streptomyces cyaneofuscatus]|uniref:hypothetical protein n=1 Tax=Streptomyces cyaneofuscatus TaxID=66883 RepID=UPI0037BBEC5B